MRKVFLGAALAFACLAGTAASAGAVVEHGHANTHFAGGGWTGGNGVGGWKGNYSGNAAAGATSSVTFGPTKAPATFNVVLGRRDLERRELTQLLRDPNNCIFVSVRISGARWRPGCK